MQQMRDEAHRFAVTFHRSVRSKRIIQTELHQIKGVGGKRAKRFTGNIWFTTGCFELRLKNNLQK